MPVTDRSPYREVGNKVAVQTILVGNDGGLAQSAAATKANVADAAVSTTILAANAARRGALIYNDSTVGLYLDLTGGTASATSFSVYVPPASLYELLIPYTGAITGIWVSDQSGSARVTEFVA